MRWISWPERKGRRPGMEPTVALVVDPRRFGNQRPGRRNVASPGGATGHCQHRLDAGAFVLGALGRQERVRYQAHLPGCRPCHDEVVRLVGVPALLKPLSGAAWAEVAAHLAVESFPDPPRPRLARRGSRQRRVALLSAAAVLAAGVLCAAVGPLPARAPARAPAVVAVMRPVATSGPVYALLALEPVAHGSRISLMCAWSDTAAPGTSWRLRMTITNRRHRTLDVADWAAAPGVIRPVSAWADLEPSEVARVDVRRDSGTVILTYQP